VLASCFPPLLDSAFAEDATVNQRPNPRIQ
jgi:hypothetical protein